MTWLCFLSALLVVVAFFAGSVLENCMSWAVRQRLLRGGKLLSRRSHFAEQWLAPERRTGPLYWLVRHIPHFAWADPAGVIWQYTVTEEWKDECKQMGIVRAWMDLWIYDGQVVQGDPDLGETTA